MYNLSKTAVFILVLGLLWCLPLVSIAQKDVPITVESGIIPPEFNMNNDTFLIAATGNPFYALSMKKHFKKSYTGNFIVAKKISDHSVENCRYVLYEGTSTTTVTTTGGPGGTQSHNYTGHQSFYIYDRKTKKEYNNPNIASPKLIKAYLKGLDAARQK
jgi:hypothetical protein